MSKTVLTLYRDFHDLYARANSNLSKGQAHDEANLKWNSMKKGGVLDQEAYNVEVNTLKSKLRKRKLTMFDFVNNKKQPCVVSTPQPHAPPDSSASTSISGDSTASKSVSSSAQTTSTTLTNPVTETDSSNLVENQADHLVRHRLRQLMQMNCQFWRVIMMQPHVIPRLKLR